MKTVPPGDGARTHFGALTDLADTHALGFVARGVLADLVGRVDADGELHHITLTDWAATLGIDRASLTAAVEDLAAHQLVEGHFPRGHAGRVALRGPAADLVCGDSRERPAPTSIRGDSNKRPGPSPTSGDSRERPGGTPQGHKRAFRLVASGLQPQADISPYASGDSRERPGISLTSGDSREPPAGSRLPKVRKEGNSFLGTPATGLFDQLCAAVPPVAASALRHRSNAGARRRIAAQLDGLAAQVDVHELLAAVTRDLPETVRNWPGLFLARLGEIAADPAAALTSAEPDGVVHDEQAAEIYGRHQARQVAGGAWDRDAATSEIRFRYAYHPARDHLVAVATTAMDEALSQPLAALGGTR